MKFYATIPAGDERVAEMPPCCYLYPASSFSLPRFKMRAPKIPSTALSVAADCGGFVAMKRWGGVYQYTKAEYFAWLCKFARLDWAATMDWCCEQEIATNQAQIRVRQLSTTNAAWEFFTEYRDSPWAWVPTVQGWEVEDYRRHARELAPLVEMMRGYYCDNPWWRVGIGTLCQRADARMIRTVARAVAEELPGVPLHLWGVKLAALNSAEALPETIDSVDSAAWNSLFYQGREKFHQSGLTQRVYGYRIALPEYQRKFEAMLSRPRQTTLSFA